MQVGKADAEASRPATLRQLLEYYALDMVARGKGEESVGRVGYTRKVIEDIMPALLDKPVSAIGDAEVFAFRSTRVREGTLIYDRVKGKTVLDSAPTRPSTINWGLATLGGGPQEGPVRMGRHARASRARKRLTGAGTPGENSDSSNGRGTRRCDLPCHGC